MAMATYEFHCQKCDLNFEPMFSFGQYQKKPDRSGAPIVIAPGWFGGISLFEDQNFRKRVSSVGGPANVVNPRIPRRPDERA